MQTIISGAGAQPVWVYATDAHGRIVRPGPSTAVILDLELPESDATRIKVPSSPATIDPVSTVTTAAAGPKEADARRVPVADATSIEIGIRHVLTGGGASEAIEVERVDGLVVWARDELRTRFAAGATFEGARVSIDFPALVADDPDELDRRAIFGADWNFTAVTGPTVVRTLARIERRGKSPRATALDLERLDPRLAISGRGRTTLEAHLAQADDEVTAKLEWRGDQVANTADGKLGKLAVLYRALTLAYRTLGDDYLERATWAEREHSKYLGMLVSGHKADDQAETTRATDRVVPRRRAAAAGVIIK